MRIDGWGVVLLIWVFALIPWLAWRTSRRLGDNELPLPRAQFFWQTAFFQLFLYALALVAAGTNDTHLRMLPRDVTRWWTGPVLLLGLLATLRIGWRFRTEREKQLLFRILPRDRTEIWSYIPLCIAAGVSEEVVFRGTAFRLLLRLGLTIPAAVVLLVIAFAAGHATQGLRSAIAIAVIAAAFHLVVIYTGALLPAIVVHFAYDAIAGVLIPRWVSAERRGAAADTAPDR